MSSAPKDVKGNTVLQYELEKQSGFDVKHNADLNDKRIAKLRQMDAKHFSSRGRSSRRSLQPFAG